MTDAVQNRPTGAESVIWDLSVFYDSLDDARIQDDIERLNALVDAFHGDWRGKLETMSAADFVRAYQALEAIYDLRGRLESFAFLNFSTDTGNAAYQALVAKTQDLGAALSQKMVFFELEWNAIEDDKARLILDDPLLEKYCYYLEADRRYKPFQLSEPEEQIIIEAQLSGSSAWTRFFTQLTSGLRFDWLGEEANMSLVLNKLYDADRDVREMAWRKITDKLEEKSMELTFIFNTLALGQSQ